MNGGMRSDEERTMDADIQAAEPPIVVKLAAAVHGMAGLFVGLVGLQLLGVTFRAGWANFVPPFLCVLGLTGIFLAAMQYRARGWAGIGSAILGVVAAVTMLGWLFYTLTSVLSCIVYVAVPLSGLAAILNLIAVGPILKTAQARQRLSDRGMNLGL